MVIAVILVAFGAGAALAASKFVVGIVALVLGTLYLAARIYFRGRVNMTKVMQCRKL